MIPIDFEVDRSFISYLTEIRNRVVYVILFVLVLFVCLSAFANEIYSYLAGPLLKHLPEHSTMIAIDVASPFFTPFKLVFLLAIFISIPIILSQVWYLIAPSLYKQQKRLVLPLLFFSTLLFYIGDIFVYFVVFPMLFGFMSMSAPEGVVVMTDISKYLDFILALFLAFGFCFEMPILTILLVWTGAISSADLAEMRPYVIVGVFIVAMFLTPPDAISQTLLAVPMWILFELGLLFSRYFVVKPDKKLSIG